MTFNKQIDLVESMEKGINEALKQAKTQDFRVIKKAQKSLGRDSGEKALMRKADKILAKDNEGSGMKTELAKYAFLDYVSGEDVQTEMNNKDMVNVRFATKISGKNGSVTPDKVGMKEPYILASDVKNATELNIRKLFTMLDKELEDRGDDTAPFAFQVFYLTTAPDDSDMAGEEVWAKAYVMLRASL